MLVMCVRHITQVDPCKADLGEDVHALLDGVCDGVVGRGAAVVAAEVTSVLVVDLAFDQPGGHSCTGKMAL